jgi:Uma2 family endonuclease
MPAPVTQLTTFVSDREWRVQDLRQMPDGYRYEILNGVLYMAAMPFWPHPLVIENLQRTLGNWIWQHGLGHLFSPQTGIYYSETQYVDPDLLFVRPEQTPSEEEEGWLRQATLVIEVVSGSNTRAPREEREALFHRVNVEEIWYADPKQKSVEICARTDEGFATVSLFRGDDIVTSRLCPGFSVPAAELWGKNVTSD